MKILHQIYIFFANFFLVGHLNLYDIPFLS